MLNYSVKHCVDKCKLGSQQNLVELVLYVLLMAMHGNCIVESAMLFLDLFIATFNS